MTTADALDLPLAPPPGGQILHQTDRCTVVWGDCTDEAVLAAIPTVDLLVTDPPYGIGWISGFNRGRFGPLLGDDGTLDVPGLLGAIARAHLRRFRHAYVFGYRPDQLAEPMQLGGTCELVWDKGIIGPGDLTQPWGPQHERISFGARVSSAANRARGDGALTARLRAGSILRYQRPNSRSVGRHPTEKPVPLLADLIESSSRRGELVLDPCVGVGSTAVAAILTGRHAYVIEIDRRYADVAADRVRTVEHLADQIARA